MSDVQKLADRYVAIWNETDDAMRRKTIAEIWAADGRHYSGTLEAHGYDALEKRITGSNEKNIKIGGNRFRSVKNAQALRNVVFFNWEMTPAGDDKTVVAAGVIVLIVDEKQRILFDYQFFF